MVKWSKATEFRLKRLRSLVGAEVVGVGAAAEDQFGDEHYALRLRKGNKHFALWFYRDEEANGPGDFEIQEVEDA